jgi:hypothetical protein
MTKWEYMIIRLDGLTDPGYRGGETAFAHMAAGAQKAINSAGLNGWRLSKIVTTTYKGSTFDFHAIMEREVEA